MKLHKGSQTGDSGHLACKYIAYGQLTSEPVDALSGCVDLCLVVATDGNRALVVDVDAGAGLFLYRAYVTTTRPDQGADLIDGYGHTYILGGEHANL